MAIKKRLLWIVNHKTLMAAEVPIFTSLGWQVFIPKKVPDHDPGYRSSAVTYEYDSTLDISPVELKILNNQNFFEKKWSNTVAEIINKNFSVLITGFNFYNTPISEAVLKFPGKIITRPFGREDPRTYREYCDMGENKNLFNDICAVGDRFVFGQGYDNLADVEPQQFKDTAHTITIPLPDSFYDHEDTWVGGGGDAIFLCPDLTDAGYYSVIYKRIKENYGDLPHKIFGKQTKPIDDPHVLPYLSYAQLNALYAEAPVFVYPHIEPRHIHYSPLEAIIVGTPVLFLKSSLMGFLADPDAPGACEDEVDMRAKLMRILAGDNALVSAIRNNQKNILRHFTTQLARSQWQQVLDKR